MRHRLLIVSLLLATSILASEGRAQQKVDIRRAASPTVSVRLGGLFSSIKVIAWPNDSIALTGVVGAGNRLDGGPLNFAGPATGMKFFIEGTSDANVAANKLELRVPRNARVWLKTGSADIDVQGVGGGLDLNIIGGSIRVHGKPRELLVESMDGAVTFTGFTDYARIKTATGAITLEGGGEDILLTTVSGTIQAANGERPLQRARFESVTGPITYAGEPSRGADLRFDTHSGSIELRFPRTGGLEMDASTVTGTIENGWNTSRPIAGREGRGMELGFSSGMGGARVQVRSFKGNLRLSATK
jgi:hypothetical protein